MLIEGTDALVIVETCEEGGNTVFIPTYQQVDLSIYLLRSSYATRQARRTLHRAGDRNAAVPTRSTRSAHRSPRAHSPPTTQQLEVRNEVNELMSHLRTEVPCIAFDCSEFVE